MKDFCYYYAGTIYYGDLSRHPHPILIIYSSLLTEAAVLAEMNCTEILYKTADLSLTPTPGIDFPLNSHQFCEAHVEAYHTHLTDTATG